MKGDKVVELLQIIAQNSLLGYTWNGYNCVPHKFFIKIIYCTTRSKRPILTKHLWCTK